MFQVVTISLLLVLLVVRTTLMLAVVIRNQLYPYKDVRTRRYDRGWQAVGFVEEWLRLLLPNRNISYPLLF